MIKRFLILIGLLVSLSANAVEDMVAGKEISNQLRGNYGSMDREDSTPLGATQRAWDKSKGRGVYEVEYKANAVIKVRVREWMDTAVVLPKWEEIQQVFVGNEEYIKTIRSKKNIVILKPLEVGADTNITIVGHNTYLLYVRVEGYNSKNVPDLRVNVRAFPPRGLLSGSEKKLTKKEINDYLEQALTEPEDLDFKFSMSGDPSIAPDLVYSDGIRTFLNYGDKLNTRNLPVVFLVQDGIDTPANSTVIKNAIVVDGHGKLTLRNGGKTTCVYPSKLGRHSYVKNK